MMSDDAPLFTIDIYTGKDGTDHVGEFDKPLEEVLRMAGDALLDGIVDYKEALSKNVPVEYALTRLRTVRLRPEDAPEPKP